MALRHHERRVATRSAQTLEAKMSHVIPQIIPLASDTPRLRQPVSRSPVARRHANALSTKAAQIPVALRHRERRVATRSAHTFEANTSHDTTKHPAHQRHAAFTPPCFALPSGTAPRKHTFHQGCANPNGTVTSRTSCRHTVCPHNRSSHASVSYETSSKSHASRLQDERFVRASYETSSESHVSSLQNERFVRDFLKNSHVKVYTSKPGQSTAPATKSDDIVSCELQQNLHRTTRLE